MTLARPNDSAISEEFEFSALAHAYFYPRAILNEFRPFLRGTVLDVGAGIGQLTELLAQEPEINKVVAVEPDSRFARRFRVRLPQLQLYELASTLMPTDTACDAVTSINVLEHIEDQVGELKHYRSWLAKARGFLCLLVPARPELYSAIDKDFGHFRRYTRHTLERCLTESGFAVHRLYYFNFPGYFAWAVNFKFLRRRSFEPAKVALFDRWIFRWCHALEYHFCRPPWGQSLIAIGRAE